MKPNLLIFYLLVIYGNNGSISDKKINDKLITSSLMIHKIIPSVELIKVQ